jgi:hypothetical protein
VLRDLGGRYRSGRTGGYVFADDPAAGLARVLDGGSPSDRVAEGFVRTPDGLADRLCLEFARIDALPEGSRVLEPSAGDGAIVHAVHRANPGVDVTAVETDRERLSRVFPSGGPVRFWPKSFEEFGKAFFGALGGDAYPWFDAVVMNPPFSVPGNRTIWVDHVELAWAMLRPGGRLAAVVPAGFGYRADRAHERIRGLAREHGGADELPDGTFKAGGTAVRTCVLWAVRP